MVRAAFTDGLTGLLFAVLVPLGVVLGIGVQGVALGFGWIVLTILIWGLLGLIFPSVAGRSGTVVFAALSSLLAAMIVVSLIGR